MVVLDLGAREYNSTSTLFRSAIGRSFNRRDDIRLGELGYWWLKLSFISIGFITHILEDTKCIFHLVPQL